MRIIRVCPNENLIDNNVIRGGCIVSTSKNKGLCDKRIPQSETGIQSYDILCLLGSRL